MVVVIIVLFVIFIIISVYSSYSVKISLFDIIIIFKIPGNGSVK